ncbi:hypothetical protein RFN28_03695 [Mesorhizobium sp. VK24D]|uniref:Uncharacterized protein n=1 Tax=Mesorhizobium album TaxID=3072314 RepID=A0ABU4XS93_9HYPH|nr:hypothetical protein [Mesorhizobium sp. VK24D]MDX8477581.1 hypothetical protein [Mesorhizobium sp. VK24D]
MTRSGNPSRAAACSATAAVSSDDEIVDQQNFADRVGLRRDRSQGPADGRCRVVRRDDDADCHESSLPQEFNGSTHP